MPLGFVILLWQLFLHSYEAFRILTTAAAITALPGSGLALRDVRRAGSCVAYAADDLTQDKLCNSEADDLGDGFHVCDESHLLSKESLFPSIYLFLQVLVIPVTSPY